MIKQRFSPRPGAILSVLSFLLLPILGACASLLGYYSDRNIEYNVPAWALVEQIKDLALTAGEKIIKRGGSQAEFDSLGLESAHSNQIAVGPRVFKRRVFFHWEEYFRSYVFTITCTPSGRPCTVLAKCVTVRHYGPWFKRDPVDLDCDPEDEKAISYFVKELRIWEKAYREVAP